MNTFRRPQLDELVHSLTEQVHPRIVALTGPRQTGKTTMIRQALRRVDIPSRYLPVDERLAEHAHRRDEEGDSIRTGWLLDAWQKAREDAEQSDRGFVLALDEVQHVKGWSTIVKGQWDRDRWTGCPLRVIVAGSAPWTMLTGLNESLAGRFMPVEARHWSFSEMSAAFDFSVDQYLFFGGYPGTASAVENVEAWRKGVLGTIVAPAIERDIIALTRVDKPPLMRRLMALAARYSGQMLSYNKMLGQLQEAGNTTTLATYLDLLSDAGLVTGLPRYSAKPYPGQGVEPEAERPQYSADDGAADLLLRRGTRRPHVLGPAGRERSRRAPRQHGRVRRGTVQLAGRATRGRLRALPRSQPGRHRGQERTTTGAPQRTVEVPEAVPGCPDARGGGSVGCRWRSFSPTRRATGPTTRRPPRPAKRERAVRSVNRHPDTNRHPRINHADHSRGIETRCCPGGKPTKTPSCAMSESGSWRASAWTRTCWRGAGGRRGLWHLIGRAYMGAMPEHFQDDPIVRLRVRLGDDEGLLASVLAGLPWLVGSDDLPSLEEVVRREEEFAKAPPFTDTVPRFTYQILAGMGRGRAARRRCAGRARCRRGRQGRRLLLHHALRGGAGVVSAGRPGAPGTLRAGAGGGAQVAHPAAEGPQQPSLRARRRSGPCRGGATRCTPGCSESSPRAVPERRCRRYTRFCGPPSRTCPRMSSPGEFRRRAAAKGMDVAQRAVWLGAGLIVSAREYRPAVEDFVARGREPRARHILRFLVPAWRREPAIAEPWVAWDTADIAALVKALGSWYDPWWGGLGSGSRIASSTFSLRVDGLIKRWLTILAERQTPRPDKPWIHWPTTRRWRAGTM